MEASYKLDDKKMAPKSSNDIKIETLYELKALIDETIDNLETATSNPARPLIDAAEECLVSLNEKTRSIYSSMLSEQLGALESAEMIESKKENTSQGG